MEFETTTSDDAEHALVDDDSAARTDPPPPKLSSSAMLLFQSGIVAMGGLLGLFFGLIPLTTALQAEASLGSTHWFGRGTVTSTLAGIVVAVAMFLTIYLLAQADFAWMRKIERLIGDQLIQLLRKQSLWFLITFCCLAGIGEELLFRWAIQGGIERALLSVADPTVAWTVAAICSGILFGLAHFVTRAYLILATLIGLLLSLLVYLGGGLWAAILAHGLYDFLALLWLIKKSN